jgi:hypothetical protein
LILSVLITLLAQFHRVETTDNHDLQIYTHKQPCTFQLFGEVVPVGKELGGFSLRKRGGLHIRGYGLSPAPDNPMPVPDTRVNVSCRPTASNLPPGGSVCQSIRRVPKRVPILSPFLEQPTSVYSTEPLSMCSYFAPPIVVSTLSHGHSEFTSVAERVVPTIGFIVHGSSHHIKKDA